ncbi:hypothetical protein BDW74DRAFT_171976 [Aspergillus multicolor]|uniref:uncharacterized protein n=1 Tax=Aspergillus multicolor TaxID=41759 RepID=UPI003CCD7823
MPSLPKSTTNPAPHPEEKTGIHLSAKVSWLTISTDQNGRCAAWLVKHFVRMKIATGCNNYRVDIAFHRANQEWLVAISAWEYVSVSLGSEWTGELRSKFKKSKYLDTDSSKKRRKWALPVLDKRDARICERGTQFKCVWGYPFILWREGEKCPEEIRLLNALLNFVAYRKEKRKTVPESEMAKVAGRTDETRELLLLLERLSPRKRTITGTQSKKGAGSGNAVAGGSNGAGAGSGSESEYETDTDCEDNSRNFTPNTVTWKLT